MKRSRKQLSDANDLVYMLEHLVASFASGSLGNSDVPWAGIRLTLRQVRESISSAQESMIVGNAASAESGVVMNESHHSPFADRSVADRSIGGSLSVAPGPDRSLADRVMPVPARGVGRARELSQAVGNSNIGRVEPGPTRTEVPRTDVGGPERSRH